MTPNTHQKRLDKNSSIISIDKPSMNQYQINDPDDSNANHKSLIDLHNIKD